MPVHGVMRLGYVHARVTDLAEAKQHYGNTMGLYPVHDEPGRAFFKGWDEYDHHSLVLEEGGVGLVKLQGQRPRGHRDDREGRRHVRRQHRADDRRREPGDQ
jgi:catechol 2,3-dioxygenase